ncbi:hypothetical protein KPATCC21470_1014 [Kitasatospora purpeofusca]
MVGHADAGPDAERGGGLGEGAGGDDGGEVAVVDVAVGAVDLLDVLRADEGFRAVALGLDEDAPPGGGGGQRSGAGPEKSWIGR